MKAYKTLLLTVSLLLAVTITSANAGLIRSASSVTTDMGEFVSILGIDNIINGSGLNTPYNSGVDDFDAYVNSVGATHTYAAATLQGSSLIGNEWFSAEGTQRGSITFDMGEAYKIDKFALWNEDSQGIFYFTVSTSLTGDDWGFFGSGQLFRASDTDHDTSYGPDIFTLSSTTLAQYIRIDVLNVFPNALNGTMSATIGEVAFSTVPEPIALLLLGTGIIGLVGIRRKMK